MRRVVALSLVAGLLVSSLAAPAVAGKKKKKKPPAPVATDVNYFPRRDVDDCEPSSLFLSLTDAEDVAPGSCGNSNYGVPGMLVALDPVEYSTREGDGTPVTLDATKEIKGLVGVKSVSQGTPFRIGFGNTTLHVELSGMTDGQSKTIATGDFDYTVVPGTVDQVYEIEITLTPDATLDKAVFTSLTLSLRNNGESFFHGFYTTDNPASFFTLGTWK